MRTYETFATTADAGIRFRGRGFRELYGNALRGLNLLLFGANLRSARDGVPFPFCFHGDGPETVLVNFLSEVLFQAYHRERRVAAAEIRRAGRGFLKAELLLVPSRRAPRIGIKSATYHNLHVSDKNGVLRGAVVFDA